MAFDFLNQQVRLNFSNTAETVIAHDMDILEVSSRSTFINTILENYYENANASIIRQLSNYEDALASINGYDNAKLFVNRLIEKKKDELLKIVSTYENIDKSITSNPIRLWDKFANFLRDESLNFEDEIYNSVPKYCKAIIEEYTRLPFVKRELVFYKNTVNAIELAIRNEYQIFLTSGVKDAPDTKPFSCFMIPYKIMTDPLSSANYLVGYSYLSGQTKADKKMCSFRISRLLNVKNETSRSAFLSKANKEALNKAIENKGVMFLLADNNDSIKIRLSPQGINMYKTQIHMRPIPIDVKEDIYTFNCSILQARNYFFKFGKDAEILEPQYLRDQFKEAFTEAAKLY